MGFAFVLIEESLRLVSYVMSRPLLARSTSSGGECRCPSFILDAGSKRPQKGTASYETPETPLRLRVCIPACVLRHCNCRPSNKVLRGSYLCCTKWRNCTANIANKLEATVNVIPRSTRGNGASGSGNLPGDQTARQIYDPLFQP